MKVVGYCRVSTDMQAQEGVSLDAQRARIEAWAASNSHEVLAILQDEGISGKSMSRRPNLLAALEMVKREKGVFIVYSMSRMSRSVTDAITIASDLHAAGAEFVSINERIDTTTAMGRAFYAISATFNQLERELIVERTQAAMDHKRSKGEFLGNAPFGWTHQSMGEGQPVILVPNVNEQRGIQIIRELLEAEEIQTGDQPKRAASYAAIARALNHAEIRPRWQFVPHPDKPGARKRLPAGPDAKWDRGTARRIVQEIIKKGDQPSAHQSAAA